MYRVVGLLPGRQMALGISAIRRRDRQAVVVIDVARSASRNFSAVGHEGVRVRQGETKCVVVELAVSPLRNGMARRAS